ncbi:SRPBCC family protein [Kitasatospora viridis]|uniref:Polyketide cyclase/dehydrase/lipid transport protein n=1 Tax=Kitasatospora viridis TaxID=281105 RepID=A0A561S9M6_9ACTN|nr:SRPBCC family protein [Kitasatospora viridis]TWF71569.1 polyketide cyclase/dehydrase/lipid transport protein [Kitasatospora viridis]
MPAIRTALLALPLAAALLAGATAPAGAATTARPAAPLTCRGQGVDPHAAVRYRASTVIHAPLHTVWGVQTDVAHWPSWQQPVTSAVRLDHGPLRPGSAFRWTTPVPPTAGLPATTLVITSTVRQLAHDSCIRWTGPADGAGLHIDGVHVWNFTEVPGGVLVSTEETHTGPQVDADVPTATAILKQGLDAWLAALRTTAEQRARHTPPRPPRR